MIAIKTRGNSLETPNVWVLSTFHPNVRKQPPPPQCLTRSGGCTPTLLSRRAGRDVDATAAADRTRTPRRCHVSTGQNKKGATRCQVERNRGGERFSREREQDGQPREGEKESGHGCFCPSNYLCSLCLHFQHTLHVPNAPLVPLLLPKACSIGPSSLSLSIFSSLMEGTQTDEKIVRAACQ